MNKAQVALHEAGHAVAVIRLKGTFEYVSIETETETLTDGGIDVVSISFGRVKNYKGLQLEECRGKTTGLALAAQSPAGTSSARSWDRLSFALPSVFTIADEQRNETRGRIA